MAEYGWPRRTPDVPAATAGTVLRLAGDDWRYGRGQPDPGQPVDLVVARVRADLGHHFGHEFVFVAGHRPGCGGDHQPCIELLVAAAALAQQAPAQVSQ